MCAARSSSQPRSSAAQSGRADSADPTDPRAGGLTGLVDAALTDAYLFAVPLYNWTVPAGLHTWFDWVLTDGRLRVPGDEALAGRPAVVVHSRGGGYGEGTPREGWDHAEPWLPHGVSLLGLEPRFITAELTLADVTPQMAALKPLAAESLAAARRAIDGLWTPAAVAA